MRRVIQKLHCTNSLCGLSQPLAPRPFNAGAFPAYLRILNRGVVLQSQHSITLQCGGRAADQQTGSCNLQGVCKAPPGHQKLECPGTDTATIQHETDAPEATNSTAVCQETNRCMMEQQGRVRLRCSGTSCDRTDGAVLPQR